MQKNNQELYEDHLNKCIKAFGLPFDIKSKITIDFEFVEHLGEPWFDEDEVGNIWRSKVVFLSPYCLPDQYKNLLEAEGRTLDECLEIISQRFTFKEMESHEIN